MPKDARISKESGEKLAIQALGFLAQDPERLGAFMAASGIGPEMIRRAAADPAFLAGVLDHVVSDDSLLLAVAEHAGVKPEAVMRAHVTLSGSFERDLP